MLPKFELYDFLILFIYLFVIYFWAILYVQKKKKTDNRYRFFIPALSIKIMAGLVYAFYHVYIYGGGDTFVFFNAGKDLAHYIAESPFGNSGVYLSGFNPDIHDFSPSYNYILKGEDVLFIVKITSLIYWLGAGSYYGITLLFSVLSFGGLWLFYLTFSKLYPYIERELFFAMFAVPTMLLWSSGVLKDTVTIGALGGMVYAVANVFIFKKQKLMSIIIFFIGFFLIFKMKPYLIYIVLPSLLLWVQGSIKEGINSRFLRGLITPVLLISIVVSLVYVLTGLSSSAGKYSIDNWQSTLQGFHSWHSYLSEKTHQSGYSLGEMEYTVTGVIKKFPAAINVTFFRPYLWEIRNIPTLLGALEALAFFFITIYILIKTGKRVLFLVVSNKELVLLLSFALSFGFIVGLSSYNFGALSRYKIPAELFYLTALAILYGSMKKRQAV